MLTMLAMNGIELEYKQQELYEIILKVASSEFGFDELLEWVLEHGYDPNFGCAYVF